MAHSPIHSPAGILVCFAVPEEAAPFRPLRPPHADILVTGMGATNARQAFTTYLDHSPTPPSAVLTCGFAGGLHPDLPRSTVLHEVDPSFPDTPVLLAAGSRPARFHCATRVAITPAEKADLRRITQADAVEMESGVLRELCQKRGIPSATVRVISDAAGDTLPVDFNALMSADMRLDFRKLATHLILHPTAIPGLLRLRRHTLDAARQLTSVLHRFFSHGATGAGA